jgi:DNA-binding response OmpR family regulator
MSSLDWDWQSGRSSFEGERISDSAAAVVWVIDAEQWPRALLRAELIERGFDAVARITVRDAVESLPERLPDAIVVDLRGQPLPLVERLRGLGVPVVIVAGTPEINDLPGGEWVAVMRRPVSIGEIADRVAVVVGGIR